MSATPRTDAARIMGDIPGLPEMVPIEFTRQLETELAEAKAQTAYFRNLYENYKKAHGDAQMQMWASDAALSKARAVLLRAVASVARGQTNEDGTESIDADWFEDAEAVIELSRAGITPELREMVKDKERLDGRIIRIVDRNELGEPVACIHKEIDLRAAIDNARKEEAP